MRLIRGRVIQGMLERWDGERYVVGLYFYNCDRAINKKVKEFYKRLDMGGVTGPAFIHLLRPEPMFHLQTKFHFNRIHYSENRDQS